MMSPRRVSWFREIGGTLLVLFALAVAASEIGLHVFFALREKKYDVSWLMLIIALVLGFIGMYILNPLLAKDGGKFLVDNSIRVITVIRNGRRKNDNLNVTLEDQSGNSAEVAIPVDAPDQPEVPLEKIADSLGQLPHRRETDKPERAD